jgi:hypothetical protein
LNCNRAVLSSKEIQRIAESTAHFHLLGVGQGTTGIIIERKKPQKRPFNMP